MAIPGGGGKPYGWYAFERPPRRLGWQSQLSLRTLRSVLALLANGIKFRQNMFRQLQCRSLQIFAQVLQ